MRGLIAESMEDGRRRGRVWRGKEQVPGIWKEKKEKTHDNKTVTKRAVPGAKSSARIGQNKTKPRKEEESDENHEEPIGKNPPGKGKDIPKKNFGEERIQKGRRKECFPGI